MSKSSILRELSARFDGARRIKLSQAGSVIGYSVGTCRNKIQKSTFPLNVVTEKSASSNDKKHVRHYVLLTDLAELLASQEAVSSLPTGKRRVGRPTKAEQIARAKKKTGSLAMVS